MLIYAKHINKAVLVYFLLLLFAHQHFQSSAIYPIYIFPLWHSSDKSCSDHFAYFHRICVPSWMHLKIVEAAFEVVLWKRYEPSHNLESSIFVFVITVESRLTCPGSWSFHLTTSHLSSEIQISWTYIDFVKDLVELFLLLPGLVCLSMLELISK